MYEAQIKMFYFTKWLSVQRCYIELYINLGLIKIYSLNQKYLSKYKEKLQARQRISEVSASQ
jgi:hypothetical protein